MKFTPEHERKARELLWPLDFYDSSGDPDCGAHDGDFDAIARALEAAESEGRRKAFEECYRIVRNHGLRTLDTLARDLILEAAALIRAANETR